MAWALTRTLHAFVVVGIDAHLLLLGAKRELTTLKWLELMVALQVRPAPHTTVDDVRQPLAVRHLKAAIQGAWDGDTAARLARAAQRLLQLLHGTLFLL